MLHMSHVITQYIIIFPLIFAIILLNLLHNNNDNKHVLHATYHKYMSSDAVVFVIVLLFCCDLFVLWHFLRYNGQVQYM